MADFLSLIGTILNDRARRAAMAQEQQQFAEQMGLNREKFGEEKNQFGKTFTQRQLEADRGFGLSQEELALNKRRQEEAQLAQLSSLVGAGATNMGQADILSLLANRYGVPLNKASLLNTGRGRTSPAGGSAPYGSLGYVTPLGRTLPEIPKRYTLGPAFA